MPADTPPSSAAADLAASASGATDTRDTATQAAIRTIDVTPAGLSATLQDWVDGFIALIPNIVVALIVFALAWLLSGMLRRGVSAWGARRDRANLGDVLGGFVKAAAIVAGALLALTIVLPSLNPGDLVAGLGIGSVAIGFAFKDILQNWLAGLLILLRRPFRPGDQIVVSGHEGTVERIETRVTAIKTYDGRLALIPNSDVYTNAVTVNTAFAKRRSEYDVGIGYGDDIRRARDVILAAVRGVDGVEADPPPEVLVTDLAASWVTLRPRWWTDSVRRSTLLVKSDVITAIKIGLDEAGIDMPFETVVQLFHDQTEEADGVRGSQREGWPGHDATRPRSRLELSLAREAGGPGR